MDPYKIIDKYYSDNIPLKEILIAHSEAVTDKAIAIAEQNRELNLDLDFIREAALLHDIGIVMTKVEAIHCRGTYPYIAHGYLGREILEKEGAYKHALVCERHTGCGLTIEDIEKQSLPIPVRDMVPITTEEKLICFADKFFSKSGDLRREKSMDKIRESMLRHSLSQWEQFKQWALFFKVDINE